MTAAPVIVERTTRSVRVLGAVALDARVASFSAALMVTGVATA